MARRLYIGNFGGRKAIRISKPGFDARTDAAVNMILASDRSQFQIAYQGSFTLNATVTTVALPVDCTGCRLFVTRFTTVRSPTGPPQNITFSTVISGSSLIVTITSSSSTPVNFANFTRTVSVLIAKE